MTRKRSPSADQELLDLVKRLREYNIIPDYILFLSSKGADPSNLLHPKICEEAAEMLLSLANRDFATIVD